MAPQAATMIVAEESYETTEPSIDNHIVKLKASGADVFFNVTTPKFAAQAIKKNAELGWKPLHLLNNVSASVGSVIKPAGYENSQDIISAAYLKDASDPQWDNDKGMKEFLDFLAKDFPEGNKLDGSVIVGFGVAQTLVQVLKQCGDDLTRENVMKQAANLKDFRTEVLLPGIKINTSPTDFAPISQLQLMRFKGEKWELFGDVISADVGGYRSPDAAQRCLRCAADPGSMFGLPGPGSASRHCMPRRVLDTREVIAPAASAAGVFFCGKRMDKGDPCMSL